jgi:hypothetical protein
MAFKLLSKNNMGIFTTLILVILLSQSRLFDFLIDTPLGRIALLTFVIFIAYTNQILGLIAVLCIVIAFNNNVNMVSGYNLYEGFDIGKIDKKIDKAIEKAKGDEKEDENEDEVKQKEAEEKAAKEAKKILNKAFNKMSLRTKPAVEGFCMTDRENNMLRGKQSNSISVLNNLREQSDDVSPSDKSIFTSDYATF